MTLWMQLVAVVAMVAATGLAAGCATGDDYAYEDEVRTTPRAVILDPADQAIGRRGPARARAALIREEGDVVRYAITYPTGEVDTSALALEVVAPKQVRAGQEYEYIVAVRNLTNVPLADVEVQRIEIEQQQQQQAGAAPTTRPASAEQQAPPAWDVGMLAAGETKTRRFTAFAGDVGTQQYCLTANYEPTICTVVQVVNPQLRITKTVPEEALICDEIVYTYTVSNVGTGVARDVRIVDTLAEGLVTAEGNRQEVTIPVGELAAGQSRDFRVPLQAQRTGTFTTRARAVSASDKVVSPEVSTVIREPVLSVNIEAPEWEYLGQPVTYQVIVENTGDAPARDTQLRLEAPAAGGQIEPRDLGVIAPGESKQVSVTMPATQRDDLVLTARALAVCAEAETAQATVQIRTLAALLVETVDNNDPVKVGETTTYQILIRNQGSGAAENVTVTAELPPGLQFVSAEGTTDVKADGQKLQFAPIKTLAPGATAVWQVEARAQQGGMVQFELRVNSESLNQEVIETEPTRLYQ